jgi:hypothetical protein
MTAGDLHLYLRKILEILYLEVKMLPGNGRNVTAIGI